MAYQSTDPYDGSILAAFGEQDAAAQKDRLHAAADCFERDWRQRSYAERALVLRRAAALMRERADALAKLATVEMGKLVAQSAGEVALSAAILDYYDCADRAQTFLAPEMLISHGLAQPSASESEKKAYSAFVGAFVDYNPRAVLEA